MVEIRLYGKLSRYAENGQPTRNAVVMIEPGARETLTSLLARAGISVEECNHIFFTGTCSSLAPRRRPTWDSRKPAPISQIGGPTLAFQFVPHMEVAMDTHGDVTASIETARR